MLLAQNWSTSLNTGTSLKLGTSGNENLDFFTNGTKRMILNTHGTLTIPGLSGIGKSLVYVDANGNVLRLPGGPAAGATCVESAWPWSQGGNYPTDNTIGTCNTSDFILKSNNVQSVFLRPSGFVGVGINNSNPQAALDISDNSFSPSVEHFKIFGDLNGSVESTCEMRFFYKPGSGGFYVNEGTFAGSATTKFRVASTASTFNTNLVVNGTSNITSNASIGGGLAVNGTSNLGTASGALLAAKLNVNMASAGNALDVYDQSSGKINFRVKSDGLVYCRELRVEMTSSTFPDFVFDKSYKLPTLREREKFVLDNKRMPYMISANEVETNGAPIGELIKGLTHNTEELTLYLIELNKKVEELKFENDLLKLKLKNIIEK